MKQTPQLAVIYGSHRQGRRCDTVAAWIEAQIDADGRFRRARIDPAQLDLPPWHPNGNGHGVAALRRQIGAADGFVVVTPEYNHGYPAALKHLVDCADDEWRIKPVAFVSYGGRSGGRHAVEQLRQVFSSLGAITVPETVAFDQVWQRFDGDGRLLDPDGWQAAANVLLDRLEGWSQLLQRARATIEFQPGAHL